MNLRSTDYAVQQLMQQLKDAREAHDVMFAQLKADFEKEVARLHQQLQEARAELARLQMLNEFSKWERTDTDAIN